MVPLRWFLLLSFITSGVTASADFHTFFGGSDNQAYLDWVAQVGSSYQAFTYMPSDTSESSGAAVHWNISSDQIFVDIGLAVRASGWCGFGFSGNGGMTGSDVFIFEAENPSVVQDYYVSEVRYPQLDVCQDWVLVNSTIDSGFLIVQVRRKLDTGDASEDLIILAKDSVNNGIPAQRVIAAWGDSPVFSYHGPNRARSAIRWLPFSGTGWTSNASATDEVTLFQDIMKTQANASFQLINSNYSVQPVETLYINFCLTGNDLRDQGVPLDKGVTIVGFEPVITSGYVHHFVVQSSVHENNDANCSFETFPEMIYAWAPGDPPLALPGFVGIPVGNETGNYRSFLINYHFNNPDLQKGKVDNSGLKFYYSFEPREQEMGMLQLGDPYIGLFGQPVGVGVTRHKFTCDPSCSAVALSERKGQNATVFREGLHMHTSGIRAVNQQFRNGELIHQGSAEYFDFKQQGIQYVEQEPFDIQPGDSFNTTCYYMNNNSEANRTFGYASSQEMCIAFLMYYPRQKVLGEYPWVCGYDIFLPGCNATYEHSNVSDNQAGIGRAFGLPATGQCASNESDGSTAANNASGSGSKACFLLETCAVMIVIFALFL